MGTSAATSVAKVMEGPGRPLTAVERPVPEPGPGEVVVRVRASSLNFHDRVNLMGLIDGPWPRVPLSDGAGEIVAVGDGVGDLGVGDRVISAFHPLWLDGPPTRAAKSECPGDTGDGWLQQHVCAPAATLTRAPAHLSDVEAASLVCAGVTAWSSLELGPDGMVGPGDVVVTLGTGGVSLFVVQLAKALGATVVLTSSSDAKLDIGRALGADHGINYATTPEWDREVRALTGKRGADLVVDLAGSTLARSVGAARMGGTVVVAGVLGGFGPTDIPVSRVMTQNIRLNGVTVGSVAAHRALAAFVERHAIVPHVSHTFGWDDVDEALRVLDANEHLGKIGITVP